MGLNIALVGLRFGAELGIVRDLTVGRINEIMLLTQPGHLQKTAGKELTPEERDELRSQIVRQKLRQVILADEKQDHDSDRNKLGLRVGKAP